MEKYFINGHSISINPTNDYVALLLDPDMKKSKGGLFLPVVDQQKEYGRVIALPDPVPSFMGSIQTGDRVLFQNGARHIVERERESGIELVLVPYFDIIAVVED